MLGAAIARVVAVCVQRWGVVLAVAAVFAVAAGAFAATHFKMNTDTTKLVSPELPWRKAEARFHEIFPQPANMILIVIDGATGELAQKAAADTSAALAKRPDLFLGLRQPGGGPFFERNGLLYPPLAQTQSAVEQIIAAQPFLGALAADPSLRGVMDALSTALKGVEEKQITLDRLARPLGELARALDKHAAGERLHFSWRRMMMEGEPDLRETRRVIEVLIKLDFGQLRAGGEPARVIRETARELGLTPANGVSVRLTGPAPIFDEEFSTLTERAVPIAAGTIGLIVLMLWFALRSWRLIAAVLATILTGLVVTTALGLAMVGAFNIISVAFVALFVGLGVDFGIQFCVRYRAERLGADLSAALAETGRGIGPSLTLAALAIAAGFFGFLPTSYRGVAELGLIAGAGMLITFALTLTLLPALIAWLKPAGEREEAGIAALAPANAYLLGHARTFVLAAVVAGAGAVALLPSLSFDFNLLNLRSREAESIATLLDLAHDPDRSPNAMDVLTSSREAAAALKAKLAGLSTVAKVVTVDDFIPADQAEKLALIADASLLLDLSLNPVAMKPAPNDEEVVASLRQTVAALDAAAATGTPASEIAAQLSRQLTLLSNGSAAERQRAGQMLTAGLSTLLGNLRSLLLAEEVSLASLPEEIARDFVAPSGQARVRVYPKGDPTDTAIMSAFRAEVAAVAPEAVGVPVSLEESGRTITWAFVEAGLYSLIAIAVLLGIVLRSARYVLVALLPLVLAGALTLATCVAIGMPLNYANIIALPLLFGIGVAFDIYFVMAWRAGARDLLQSPLTRAVIFSAGATASGFGALWFSSHPGTSSMGALLMIALAWILAVVLFVLPPLLQVTRRSGPSRP